MSDIRTIRVMKEQKVNGKRQTWGVYQQRKGVSATVWDRLGGTSTYYEASYARSVAEGFVYIRAWQRSMGRGSAYYTATGRYDA